MKEKFHFEKNFNPNLQKVSLLIKETFDAIMVNNVFSTKRGNNEKNRD